MKILILGATGLVGKNTLDLCLKDPRITEVIAPTRKPLPPQDGLNNPIVDFENLSESASWWQADAVICALGTTIKKAGTQEAFRKVDFEYPLTTARIAHTHGVHTFVLNSAMGANPNSKMFYNRVKGELETALQKTGFSSLTFVRPGLIVGDRNEFRLGEEIAKIISKILNPLLPLKYRPNPASSIAEQMVQAALAAKPGVHIVSSEKMVALK